jgi:hypothetical protein
VPNTTTSFPGGLDTKLYLCQGAFTDPTSIWNEAIAAAVAALETKVGIDSSADTSSLDYKVAHGGGGGGAGSALTFNVKDSGAVGDLKAVTDAVFNATTTVTSATANFVAGDVGKAFYGIGMGAAGADLATTIASRTNSTTIVLAAAATGSGSGKTAWYGTDDQAHVNTAIGLLNAAGRGRLYFPASAGGYLVSGATTAITVPFTVLGDGSGAYNNSFVATSYAFVSGVFTPHATANLFTINALLGKFDSIAIVNFNSAPTAGCAITESSSNAYQKVSYDDLFVANFYVGIDKQVGGLWKMVSTDIVNCVLYGIKDQNTVNGDVGDASILGSNFIAGYSTGGLTTASGSAAIEQLSGGGLKIVNVKINNVWETGVRLDIGASTQTSILLMANNSIENVLTYPVLITVASGGGFYAANICNNEFLTTGGNSGYGVLLNAAASNGISFSVVTGNTILENGSTNQAVGVGANCKNITVAGNVQNGYAAMYNAGATSTTNFQHDLP